MKEKTAGEGAAQPWATTGKVFAIGIGALFAMVVVGVWLIFVAAKKQAEHRERHPVIGRPVDALR